MLHMDGSLKKMAKSNSKASVLGVLASIALLAGCASPYRVDSAMEGSRGHGSVHLDGVNETQASLVFLREEGAIGGKPVNIFVNGEYLASLQEGGFKQSVACAGNNRLTAHYTDVRSRYLEKERQGQIFDVPAGKVSYFRVTADVKGKPELQAMDSNAGQAAVGTLKQQMHTLSRVENLRQCGKPGPA